MAYKKIFPTTALFAFFSFLILSFCDQKKDHPKNKQAITNNKARMQSLQDISDTDRSACDPGIWKHVYDPARLQVLKKCMTVTGVIEESNADDDGDQHMLLKLDAGQENLLKPKNIKKKNGWLVIEAVCMNKINKAKVGEACQGYVNHIQLPKVSTHVKVTGSYVIDLHNGWAEIHPITKIEVVQ